MARDLDDGVAAFGDCHCRKAGIAGRIAHSAAAWSDPFVPLVLVPCQGTQTFDNGPVGAVTEIEHDALIDLRFGIGGIHGIGD